MADRPNEFPRWNPPSGDSEYPDLAKQNAGFLQGVRAAEPPPAQWFNAKWSLDHQWFEYLAAYGGGFTSLAEAAEALPVGGVASVTTPKEAPGMAMFAELDAIGVSDFGNNYDPQRSCTDGRRYFIAQVPAPGEFFIDAFEVRDGNVERVATSSGYVGTPKAIFSDGDRLAMVVGQSMIVFDATGTLQSELFSVFEGTHTVVNACGDGERIFLAIKEDTGLQFEPYRIKIKAYDQTAAGFDPAPAFTLEVPETYLASGGPGEPFQTVSSMTSNGKHLATYLATESGQGYQALVVFNADGTSPGAYSDIPDSVFHAQPGHLCATANPMPTIPRQLCWVGHRLFVGGASYSTPGGLGHLLAFDFHENTSGIYGENANTSAVRSYLYETDGEVRSAYNLSTDGESIFFQMSEGTIDDQALPDPANSEARIGLPAFGGGPAVNNWDPIAQITDDAATGDQRVTASAVCDGLVFWAADDSFVYLLSAGRHSRRFIRTDTASSARRPFMHALVPVD